MVITYIPLVVCLVGLLIYLLANPQTNPKGLHVGEVMFYLGLAAFLLQCVLGHSFPFPR